MNASGGRAPFRALLLIGFAASGLGPAEKPAEWIEFSPPGGGFSIRLPAAPTQQSEAGEGMQQFELRAADQDYVVSYAELPPEMASLTVEQALERDDFVKTMPGSKLLRSTAFRIDGRSGLTWVLEAAAPNRPTFKMKMSAVVAGDRLYHYGFIARSDRFDEAVADRFLETFRLVGSP